MKLSAKICLALGGVIFAVGAYLSVVALRGDYIWTIEPPILGVGLILLGCAAAIQLRARHEAKHPRSEAETAAPAPAPDPEEEETKAVPAQDEPHVYDPRWGFPLAAAVLFSIYTVIEIFFVKGNGLDQAWVFENSITAAFIGGAGPSMTLAVIATALLWAGIASNKYGIYLTGMIVMCMCVGLWLIHVYLSALPLVLGWIGAAKWKKARRR
jgi:hypothetical protein